MTPPDGEPSGFQLLEHTADVGIRAVGRSLAEAFEQAAAGLADVIGASADPGTPASRRRVRASADDVEGLLVAFLDELVLTHETEEVVLGPVRVLEVTDRSVDAEVEVRPVAGEPAGPVVKAATYHQLRVRRHPDGRVEAVVFLDV